MAPRDQRTSSAYIFGAICPAEGKGAALVLPRCTTAAMALHLAEISQAVAPDAHAVVLLDQAGWHTTAKLPVPSNITLMPLPAKSPELNPVENIWQFMRDNWLSNRIFTSYPDILDHCCYAWNALVDQPWKITSIGLRSLGPRVMINEFWYKASNRLSTQWTIMSRISDDAQLLLRREPPSASNAGDHFDLREIVGHRHMPTFIPRPSG